MRIEPRVPVLLPPIDGGPYEARVLKSLHQTHVILREDALDPRREPVWKSKFYGVFVLNRRVDLHAIDATPARRRGGVVDLCTGKHP
mgnify:CR=1 FL=1